MFIKLIMIIQMENLHKNKNRKKKNLFYVVFIHYIINMNELLNLKIFLDTDRIN